MINKKRLKLVICLFLVVATVAAYLQILDCDFNNWDEELYVTENLNIKAGLTPESVRWAFTTGYASNWHPVTWLSHMLDIELYGLNPIGHHWTNLQIHVANALLIFLFLNWISGAIWRSAFVAALFAVHPLHVESVAWVAERKDVLCVFFWMLSMWVYVKYSRHCEKKYYAVLILLFTLGLMSKPMIVTLPFTLLLLDFWPLYRFQSIIQKQKINVFQAVLTLTREKIPLFLLSVVSSFITFFVQQHGGAVTSIESLPINVRLTNALVSYTSYIGNMVWPLNLTILYPFREWHPVQVLISGLLLLVVSAQAIRTWRKHPYFAMGWFWYLGTLIPVIGLVQVGSQRMADRYTYIPLIGLFIIVSWGIADISAKWQRQRTVLSVISGTTLLFFTLNTWAQVGYWRNGITLFEHAINVTPNNSAAICGLGQAFDRQGKHDEAIRCYLKALQVDPNSVQAHFELGVTLKAQGHLNEALMHYFRALRIKPNDCSVHNNIGVIMYQQKKVKEAVYHYKNALNINPDYPIAHYNLGLLLFDEGKIKEAILQYKKALESSPNLTEVLYKLSWILAAYEDEKYRDGEEAVRLAERLCKITQNNQPMALDVLAAAYAEAGKFDRAVSIAEKGLKLALDHGSKELVSRMKKKIKLYQKKHILKQTSPK